MKGSLDGRTIAITLAGLFSATIFLATVPKATQGLMGTATEGSNSNNVKSLVEDINNACDGGSADGSIAIMESYRVVDVSGEQKIELQEKGEDGGWKTVTEYDLECDTDDFKLEGGPSGAEYTVEKDGKVKVSKG